MFDLKSINTEKEQNPYITYGERQELYITQIELVKSSTGSQKAVVYVETEPVGNELPKLGKVTAGAYMKTRQQQDEFLGKMKLIAKALNVEDAFNEIKAESFEEAVAKISKLLSVRRKARYTVYAEQYTKASGSLGTRLFFPRWSFVESLDTPIEESKLSKFDINDQYHFKKIDSVLGAQKQREPMDDLPF